jgi:RsiW-degrading membrane proteinase PrsW (M82 family)
VFFFSAGYAAVFIPQPKVNQIACTSLLFMSVCWIIGGCMQATHKRALARRDLLRTVRHGRDIYTDSIDGTEVEQTEGNMVCAHRLCGFYPSDDKFDGDDEEPPQQRENRQDMCSCLSRMFSDACCGKLFSCQWQIFGVCALAQEGRELDRMIPMHERRFDYVTFQPYVEYFNAIRKLRKEKNESLWSHYMALSKLSRVLLKTLFTAIGVLMVVAFVIKPSIFQWGNLLVFVATFLQAFLVLYFVHWHWNKFDISLDAIIKYFACGFVITTTTALFFEMVDILFLDLLARALMSLLPVEVENDDGYGSTMDPSFFNFSPHNMYTEAVSDEYKKAFLRKYPYIFILYIFVSAYLVAAFVEELCKYFGFKIVEHPDFLTESDLRKAAAYGVPENKHRMNSERDEWGGGLDCIGDLDCVQSDSNLSGGIYDSDEENDNGQGQRSSKKDVLTRSNSGAQRSSKKDLLLPSNNGAQRSSRKDLLSPSNSGAQGMPSYVAVELTDAPPRGIQSIASAITIAMVAVSLGFACCENLIYIFLYNGKEGLSMEIAVLVSRSLIPVHPLCAGKLFNLISQMILEAKHGTHLFLSWTILHVL